MRIALGTIELDGDARLAIGNYYGMDGPADRDTCRRFIISNGMGEVENLLVDWSGYQTMDGRN